MYVDRAGRSTKQLFRGAYGAFLKWFGISLIFYAFVVAEG